jgi:DNA polymerase-4
MPVPEARQICPEIVLVTQRPDLFRRAHNTLLNEIACEIPIETVKSIDELCCRLDPGDRRAPEDLAARLKQRISDNVGPYITCSIGFAANRLLAKTACKMDKPDGTTIWHPGDMPGPLLKVPLEDISGIGARLQVRLERAGITSMQDLLATQPKQLRNLWGNVNGERMWYALQGYDVKAVPTSRGMYGHGRVLSPGWRTPDKAEACSRLLLMKAARRMRRDGYYARRLYLWLDIRGGGWFGEHTLPSVHDDHACLTALKKIWARAQQQIARRPNIIRVGVTLLDLVPARNRQLDLLTDDDHDCQRWETLTHAIDGLNSRFGKRVVTLGDWTPPPGGFTGGKIAFTRIPSAEDFW